jgi:hypothetical protein
MVCVFDSPQFLADYYKGTVAFIDEYWRIIHRAAGWAALRTWLLVSVISERIRFDAKIRQDVCGKQVSDRLGSRPNFATL